MPKSQWRRKKSLSNLQQVKNGEEKVSETKKKTKKLKKVPAGGVALFGGTDIFGGKNPFAGRKVDASSSEGEPEPGPEVVKTAEPEVTSHADKELPAEPEKEAKKKSKKKRGEKSSKKKPAGAVSLFGGTDIFGGKNPFAHRKVEASSSEAEDEAESDDEDAADGPPAPGKAEVTANVAAMLVIQPDAEEAGVDFWCRCYKTFYVRILRIFVLS